jgi:hypothetical protein
VCSCWLDCLQRRRSVAIKCAATVWRRSGSEGAETPRRPGTGRRCPRRAGCALRSVLKPRVDLECNHTTTQPRLRGSTVARCVRPGTGIEALAAVARRAGRDKWAAAGVASIWICRRLNRASSRHVARCRSGPYRGHPRNAAPASNWPSGRNQVVCCAGRVGQLGQ